MILTKENLHAVSLTTCVNKRDKGKRMEEEKQYSECPAEQVLSAWFDNEAGDDTGGIRKHVEQCPRCRAKIESFKTMTRGIRLLGANLDLEELRRKILSRTRKAVEESGDDAEGISLPWIFRIAALTAAVIFAVWLFCFRNEKPADTGESRILRSPALAEMANPAGKKKGDVQIYQTKAAYTSSLDLMENVFLPEKVFCVFGKDYYFLPVPPAVIRGDVIQNWISRSFTAKELKQHLSSFFGSVQAESKDYSFRLNTESLILNAELNARQLAVLVRQLEHWGLQLLHPAMQPLPGHSFYHGPGTQKIRCRLHILTSLNAENIPNVLF